MVSIGLVGWATQSANALLAANIGRDGISTLVLGLNPPNAYAASTNEPYNMSSPGADNPAEGNHFYTPTGQVGSGTGTWSLLLQGFVRN